LLPSPKAVKASPKVTDISVTGNPLSPTVKALAGTVFANASFPPLDTYTSTSDNKAPYSSSCSSTMIEKAEFKSERL